MLRKKKNVWMIIKKKNVMVSSYRVDFKEDGIAFSHVGKSTFESIIFFYFLE
jgi:hypothetical protein